MAKPTPKKPMQAPFPLMEVPLGILDLDIRNSRFPRDAQSQTDARSLMMTVAGPECVEMLRDLTRSGAMNSSDIPIVVARGPRYVVMEGNRRLACLQIWSSPALLNSISGIEEGLESRLRKLISDSEYEPPAALRVTIAPSESAADQWIDRKHNGGAGGAGTVSWGAAMKDRRMARNNPAGASRAMAFVEMIAEQYEDHHDILTALETVRNQRYTMIQRFVDRKPVRDILGLEFQDGRMSLRYGSGATAAIIHQVLGDFARPKASSGKTWARELDTVQDFKDYLRGYASLLPDADSTVGQEEANQAADGDDGSTTGSVSETRSGDRTDSSSPATSSGTTQSNDQRPPRPTPPQDRILVGLSLDRFTPRIQEIVRQTALLNVQRQHEIVSVMLRVILDLACYQFLKSHKREVDRHLDKNLRTSIKVIDPQASDALGQAEDTPAIRKAFHQTTADSIRLVQYAVHDVTSAHTPNEVLVLADRYRPVLEAMNRSMGSNAL